MGGANLQCVSSSDVAMLDESSRSWKRVSLLSSPRKGVAVVLLDADTILVFGGTTSGKDVAGAKAHSITTVEKGRATLTQRAAAFPEGNQCSIL